MASSERSRAVHPRRPRGDPPKVRDLPAPRRTEGGLGWLFRRIFAWPYRLALAGLYRAGIRPWELTALSLVAGAIIGWLLITGRRFVPGVLVVVAGLLDIFDGGLARLRGEDSRAGAFLDSVVDRASDMILFGCLFWSEAAQGRRAGAALSLVGLIATLLVSFIRAEGEARGLTMTEGLMQRLERYVLLIVGLTIPGALLPVLAILAGLGVVTVLQRVAAAARQLPARPPRLIRRRRRKQE